MPGVEAEGARDPFVPPLPRADRRGAFDPRERRTGDRVTPDRLALWVGLRLSRPQDEAVGSHPFVAAALGYLLWRHGRGRPPRG